MFCGFWILLIHNLQCFNVELNRRTVNTAQFIVIALGEFEKDGEYLQSSSCCCSTHELALKLPNRIYSPLLRLLPMFLINRIIVNTDNVITLAKHLVNLGWTTGHLKHQWAQLFTLGIMRITRRKIVTFTMRFENHLMT